MKKIVINSFNGIGDLLFVTPTLRRIKEKYPSAEITVNTNYPELLNNNPYVDKVGRENVGTFLGYPDPIHCVNPTKHHIMSDWEIVSNMYELDLEHPDLCPEIYMRVPEVRGGLIGVQVAHKGHWHAKKVWPNFEELVSRDEFKPIPIFDSLKYLVDYIARSRAVVCAEGGISHIAKAVGTPAIVIYGGFARPEWNGYKDQINLTNEKHCSYCYNPRECENAIERVCMKEITVSDVLKAVQGLKKIGRLENGNAKQFIEEDALAWCRGTGLDIGGGRWPLRGSKSVNEGEIVNAYTVREGDESQDFVFSSHCLEHLENPALAVAEWKRVLKRGGILYLYVPHTDYLPWRTKANRWHKHNLYEGMVFELVGDGLELLEYVPKDEAFGQKFIWRKR